MITVRLLGPELEKQYDAFLLGKPGSMFFHSNKYRILLKELLQQKDRYLVALDENNEIAGVLPAMLKENPRYGNVLNSLPFYGSNGGCIAEEPEIKAALLDSFYALAKKENCVSATLITTPFESDRQFYESKTAYTFLDSRIGQLTKLPPQGGDIHAALFDMFDPVRRRNIRKAQKNDISVTCDYDCRSFDFLYRVHEENMKEIGGIPKPERFFELVPQIFTYGQDYKIYTAYHGDEPIAALLLFYFKDSVEYFTPAIVNEHRTLQPLSLIVFEAMVQAIMDGYGWWNWGGTWLTMDGVYDFKKRWGTVDMPYYYYTKIIDDSILDCTRQELLEQYPFFYVVPFDKLRR